MKKGIILFAVACAAFAAVLIAIGIYIQRLDLAKLIAYTLAEKLGFLALIFIVAFYIPLLLTRCIFIIFIIYGVVYLVFSAIILFTLHKNDLNKLYNFLDELNIANSCLLFLLFIFDCVFLAYIITNIHSGISVVLIIFTVLINITAIALEVAGILTTKKLRKQIKKEPSV